MQKKSALGRGMNAILGTSSSERLKSKNTSPVDSSSVTPMDTSDNVSRETLSIRISLIEPNSTQPRKNFDEKALEELADSIRLHGVLQPILVKRKGQMYEIIVGERRWRAAKAAGLKEIPAVVRDMSPVEASEAALIENIQREDLSCIEEANAFRTLINEYGLTQEELAVRLSKSRTSITNSMRLLQLDPEIKVLIENGSITAGHGRALLSIDDNEVRIKAAKEIAEKDLSVRQTEKLAKNYNTKKKQSKDDADEPDSRKQRKLFLKNLESELTESIKTRVSIKETGKSKGRIEIEYYSDDDLNNLIDRLG